MTAAETPAGKEELPESPQEKKTPLLSHLLALRKTLLICAGAVAAAFVLIFALAIGDLMVWIEKPIVARGIEFFGQSISEAMMTKIKVSLIAAVIAASPVIIGQI